MNAVRTVVVIGNGMVGHKFLETLVESGTATGWNVVTFCEEPRHAYDRVYLSSFFNGKTADDLSLLSRPDYYHDHGIAVHVNDRAIAIDRAARTVTSAQGRTIAYDKLVLATGSYPFVPPIAGNDAKGCFVYRTIEDLVGMHGLGHARKDRRGGRRRTPGPGMRQCTALDGACGARGAILFTADEC